MSIEPRALDFFKQILATPSPSGYESPVQEVVRDYAASFADEMRTDVHGNVIAARNAGAPLRVMLAGHCDQIGLIVQYIDDDGFIHVSTIGGWDPQVLIGQRLTVWGTQGPVLGIIARKPIHLLNEEERKQVPKIKDLWLDIGAKSKDEVLQVVRVGDPITVELRYQELAEWAGRFGRDGRQDGAVGGHGGPAAGRSQQAASGRLRRLDGAGRDRAPRGPDQFLQRRSARRHRRRRDPRHRLPDHRKEGRGRHPPGPGTGHLPRAEHESQGGPAAVGRGRRARDSLSTGRLAAGPRRPTPMRSRSTARAWPRRWSAFPTATCTVRWK